MTPPFRSPAFRPAPGAALRGGSGRVGVSTGPGGRGLHDLVAELPGLLAGRPHRCGHIGSVLVNGTMWSLSGDGMVTEDQRAHLRRTDLPRAEHPVCLLAPGYRRRDLLAVPPAVTEEETEAAHGDGHGGRPACGAHRRR
ncbi:DUF5994 family protein [Streptomyces sp. NPDC056161]|uniref:DUF5994 family protein n=1 Tax=Streptomyces sp. NPDC056161 TaxID=3345732 RepID=UPI0035D5EA8A